MFNQSFVEGMMASTKEQFPELEGVELEKKAGELAGQVLAGIFDVEELSKEAALGSVGKFFAGMDTTKFKEGFAGSAGSALGNVAVGAGAGAALYGIGKAVSALTDQSGKRFEAALEQAIARNSVLRSADPEKVRSFAHTIFQFAPSIAQDPNLLSTVLANAIHGESVDPATIKALVEIQERHNKNRDTLGGLKNIMVKG